jgi:hypothetical protein
MKMCSNSNPFKSTPFDDAPILSKMKKKRRKNFNVVEGSIFFQTSQRDEPYHLGK